MQAALTESKPARQFANDGSLESVEGMLVGLAKKFYGRVVDQGLPMTFEDVLQEARLAYVKAAPMWVPEKAKFNTYCYRVVVNEFNRRIERMAQDRAHLGLSSVDDLVADADEVDAGDGYERYASEDALPSPEDLIERRQELRARLARLSPKARQVVLALVADEAAQSADKAKTFSDVVVALGMTREAIRSVQGELRANFGIQLNFYPSNVQRGK